ncbi:hypothetical protein [Scytonema sp. PCC 10023]|uniref:hypothetical protein n=1 Tax=Scytonema sp. PCC 10023 TaxID=1680591 RepID=UPI0039C690FD
MPPNGGAALTPSGVPFGVRPWRVRSTQPWPYPLAYPKGFPGDTSMRERKENSPHFPYLPHPPNTPHPKDDGYDIMENCCRN